MLISMMLSKLALLGAMLWSAIRISAQEHNSSKASMQHAFAIESTIPQYDATADDFIYVDGLQLRSMHGRPHFIRGMNYWSCMNLASDAERGGDISRLQIEMDQMAAVGVNHLRVMAATQGSITRQPFRILPALQSSPTEWNEALFMDLDRCIAEAGKRNMRLTMVLGNTWQWTGGNAQLHSWSQGVEIPYPRSWNMTSSPQRSDGYAGWGDWTTADDDRFIEFQGRFYHDDKAQAIFQHHLDRVLHRRNTITNRLYKNDATIMAWEPINEPTPASSNANDWKVLVDWYNTTTHYIKSFAPKQLVTTGYESKQSLAHFNDIHGINAVDYACAHMWPQIWGKYDMLDSSRLNLDRATQWSKEYVLGVEEHARSIGKPILLEEIGMPRDNWQNAGHAGKYLYDTSASTTSRDALLESIMDLVLSQYQKTQGLIGIALWSYGGIYRSAFQQYNNQGVIIAGDPPQEPPGWHSILNTDFTMMLLQDLKDRSESWISFSVNQNQTHCSILPSQVRSIV